MTLDRLTTFLLTEPEGSMPVTAKTATGNDPEPVKILFIFSQHISLRSILILHLHVFISLLSNCFPRDFLFPTCYMSSLL
jgi:hypothetical protein